MSCRYTIFPPTESVCALAKQDEDDPSGGEPMGLRERQHAQETKRQAPKPAPRTIKVRRQSQ